MTSSFQNLGFDKLYDELILRWKWLANDSRLNKLRYEQDVKWIKNDIVRNFGDKGLKKIADAFEKRAIDLFKNPQN